VKQQLIAKLQEALEAKVKELAEAITSTTQSRNSDTKSSAGDKFETSREMAQQEIDRYTAQLAQVKKQVSDLKQIDVSIDRQTVQQGCLVKTNTATYFLAIPFGKLSMAIGDVYCISSIAPIAQVMLGKAQGESFQWQGKGFEILSVK